MYCLFRSKNLRETVKNRIQSQKIEYITSNQMINLAKSRLQKFENEQDESDRVASNRTFKKKHQEFLESCCANLTVFQILQDDRNFMNYFEFFKSQGIEMSNQSDSEGSKPKDSPKKKCAKRQIYTIEEEKDPMLESSRKKPTRESG